MSDPATSPNASRRTFVVGTAGHVDHGKSTLVRRLTGIDPDRLGEEKQRAMTIDLGFAWLDLPGGERVSIIDVPGHERFIKNMLAGVGGLDAGLLIVAADEGPMPQTVEHLAILDLLAIAGGLVVITKADLVEDDWLELVIEETMDTISGTVLDNAPIIPVSAVSGAGIDDLLTALEKVLISLPSRHVRGRARLPVDRIFSVAGFGTVVTGTLLGSAIELGQELEIMPSGLRARVRGLQSHGEKVTVAHPGSRTAINLTGVDRDDVHRGDVVTIPGWLRPTTIIDTRLRVVPSAPQPLQQNDPVDVFIGAAETSAHITLLDSESIEPGGEGWVQIRLDHPMIAVEGDQFIIRQASPSITIGGGTVLNAHPRRHRRFRPDVIRDLETRESGSVDQRVLHALDAGPADIRTLSQYAGLDQDEAIDAVRELQESGAVRLLGADPESQIQPGRIVITTNALQSLDDRLTNLLDDFHRRYPLRRGMAREELRSRTGLASKVFDAVVSTLVSDETLAENGSLLALASHEVRLTDEQKAQAARYLAALQESPMSPPSPGSFGIDGELLSALALQGKLVRVDDSISFAADFFATIQEETIRLIDERGELTLAEFRDHFGSSRKYAQAVLEYFDQQRVTRRIGDVRVRGSG